MSKVILKERQKQPYSPPKRIKNQSFPPLEYHSIKSQIFKESHPVQYGQLSLAPIETQVGIHPMKETEVQPYLDNKLGSTFLGSGLIKKSNLPQKQPRSKHLPTLLVSIIFWGSIVTVVFGTNNFLDTLAAVLILTITYSLYLLVAVFVNDIRLYIENLQQYEDYKLTYDSMVDSSAYFLFTIQCYHYRTVHEFCRTRQEKVITHRAVEKYSPYQCHDESGSIVDFIGLNKFFFIRYSKKFYFDNKQSEKRFDQAYRSFISKHKRDFHQNYHASLEIDTFQKEISFTKGDHKCCFFYFCCVIGLALPYACILESVSSRYKINIVKKLTCR